MPSPITRSATSPAALTTTETFQYDNLNRLTGATIGATTKSVTYNAVGNILTKTRLGSSSSNTYTYPAAGQPKPYAVSSISGVVNGVTNPSFVYDNNGNLTQGPGRSITWTSFNKVQQITQGATTVSYVYDAEHQRLKQTTGSTTVKYFNDPASGVSAEHHSVSGGTWHDYLFADGQRIGMRSLTTSPAATSWQYYVHDHQDSVAVVTDGTGSVVQRLAYDAWGRRRHPNATEDPGGAITGPTSRGYTDHEHIESLDLINMNGRIYDPEIGRMMSADPIMGNVFRTQALNRYSYVYNNPGSFVDPSGYCDPVVCGSAIAGLAEAAWKTFQIVQGMRAIFGWLEDDDRPPLHHKPGLSTAMEHLRGNAPLVTVSAPVTSGGVIPDAGVTQASMAGGSAEFGGTKYANGANSGSFNYVLAENQGDILSEVIVAVRWTRPANPGTAKPNVISPDAAERLYRTSPFINAPPTNTAELDTVLNDKVFRREAGRIYSASVRAERELGALSVYERDGNYYIYSVGTPDPLVSNRMRIDPVNPSYGRHVLDWHPHPWGNTAPSPADLETSYRRGAPGILQHGSSANQRSIFQGVCRSGGDC